VNEFILKGTHNLCNRYERLVLQNKAKSQKKRQKKKQSKQEKNVQNTVIRRVHVDQSKTLSKCDNNNPDQKCSRQETIVTEVLQQHDRPSQFEKVPVPHPIPASLNSKARIDALRLNYRRLASRMKVTVSKFTQMLISYLQNHKCDQDFEVFFIKLRQQRHNFKRKNCLNLTLRDRFVSKRRLETIVFR
jgi:hypothetical protein